MADITLTLDAVTLDPDLRWVERQASQKVAQSVTPTIGGGVIVIAQEILAGQPITLESGEDFGFLTTEQVDAVNALADQVGGIFVLEVTEGSNVETYEVMFRHEDGPAFAAVPLIPRIVPDPGDWFRVVIKLMKV
jgi:hypothetical protein